MTSDWITTILSSIKWISATSTPVQSDTEVIEIDLAIVCALRAPELNAVLKLPWNWQPPEPLDDLTFFYRGTFTANGREWKVVAACQQLMGMIASSLLTYKLVNRLKLRAIVMLGICAGIENKTIK